MRLADPLPQVAMLVVVCLMGLRLGRPRQAVAAAVLVGGANLTTQMLKELLEHHRYQPILGWGQIGPTAFPSGHSTAAMAMALALVLVVPRSWKPAAVAIGACFAARRRLSRSSSSTTTTRATSPGGGWLQAAGALPWWRACGRPSLLRANRGAQLVS